MPFDQVTENFLDRTQSGGFKPVAADQGAHYEDIIHIDIDRVVPQIAAPHHVDNVHTISELAGTPIDMVVVGTCTNGRLKDLQ